jgi:DNA-binding CsgD family transcriptional regulator
VIVSGEGHDRGALLFHLALPERPAQQRVAGLVATGMSNREIAATMATKSSPVRRDRHITDV